MDRCSCLSSIQKKSFSGDANRLPTEGGIVGLSKRRITDTAIQQAVKGFHRSLKEEEVWTAEYRNLDEARSSIACWIEEYNHDRPHRGVENRTPHEAFLAFTGALNPEALTV